MAQGVAGVCQHTIVVPQSQAQTHPHLRDRLHHVRITPRHALAHAHVPVKAHPRLCTGSCRQGRTLSHVYACASNPGTQHGPSHDRGQPHVCIRVRARHSTHACCKHTNPPSFRYKCGCALSVVHTYTRGRPPGVCVRSAPEPTLACIHCSPASFMAKRLHTGTHTIIQPRSTQKQSQMFKHLYD